MDSRLRGNDGRFELCVIPAGPAPAGCKPGAGIHGISMRIGLFGNTYANGTPSASQPRSW